MKKREIVEELNKLRHSTNDLIKSMMDDLEKHNQQIAELNKKLEIKSMPVPNPNKEVKEGLTNKYYLCINDYIWGEIIIRKDTVLKEIKSKSSFKYYLDTVKNRLIRNVCEVNGKTIKIGDNFIKDQKYFISIQQFETLKVGQ